jgi:hypothetical protein
MTADALLTGRLFDLPGRLVGQTIAFRGLLGWAFRPRNFMKNFARLGGFPDMPGGFSPCHVSQTPAA